MLTLAMVTNGSHQELQQVTNSLNLDLVTDQIFQVARPVTNPPQIIGDTW